MKYSGAKALGAWLLILISIGYAVFTTYRQEINRHLIKQNRVQIARLHSAVCDEGKLLERKFKTHIRGLDRICHTEK